MISLDGASLIAQVYLVAILIVAVERRAVGHVPYPSSLLRRIGWWVGLTFNGLTLGVSMLAVALCVIAVSAEVPLAGWESVVVLIAGASLSFLVAGHVVTLGMAAYSGFGVRK